MESSISSVAGWLVPARGTCSRKLCSPSCSTRHTGMPACAKASDRHRPTGPAPMTTTRSESGFMPAWRPMDRKREAARSALRNDVLHGAGPTLVGEVEHDAGRILVFRLVERIGRGRPAGEIGSAGVDHLFLRFIQVVHPHAEVIYAG